MLSVKEVRELIDGDEEYSDAEIEQIRDDMQILAEIAVESFIEKKKGEREESVS